MRILYIPISGRDGASSRYRVYQFVPLLEESGFQVRVQPPFPKAGRGIRRWMCAYVEHCAILREARNADVLFIQKRLLDARVVRKLGRLGKPLVYDLDDSVFTSPAADWSTFTKARVHSRLRTLFDKAQLVLCGNEYLREFASNWGAVNAVVFPTAIDTSRYPAFKHSQTTCPVLGWIGSSVNHRYLDILSLVLPRLNQDHGGVRLLVVSDKPYGMEGVRVENRRWSEETEVRDILDMDVGLMPLADNEWTRGKCALKALQYMAAGIPAVCSPVGANVEVVENGREGFLPKDDEEWRNSIGLLLESVALREKMGAAGRQKVDRAYSLDALARKKIDLLHSL